jgi:hypothetical protein
MIIETSQKVTASQLQRSALLYIRQSTARQVLEHTESTARQYALRNRAVALGWKDDQVMVIDSDLGQSGGAFGWQSNGCLWCESQFSSRPEVIENIRSFC